MIMTSQERNRIIEENMGLVGSVIKKHFISNTNNEYDDLFQVGCIGLIKAIDKFDATKGFAFTTYAYPWIHGEIFHEFIRKDKKLIKGLSFDKATTEGENTFLKDIIKDKSIRENVVENKELIQALLEGLTDFQKQAIEMRYLKEMGVIEIANKLDCSVVSISKRLRNGLKNMRKNMVKMN